MTKESIYFWKSVGIGIGQLTYVQLIYNDPSIIHSKTPIEWAVIFLIGLVLVMTGALNTKGAYKSDPNEKARTVANGETPAPVPPVQKPADTTTSTQP